MIFFLVRDLYVGGGISYMSIVETRSESYLKLLQKYRISPDKSDEFIVEQARFLLEHFPQYPVDVDAHLLALGKTDITFSELESAVTEATRRADVIAHSYPGVYIFGSLILMLQQLQRIGKENEESSELRKTNSAHPKTYQRARETE